MKIKNTGGGFSLLASYIYLSTVKSFYLNTFKYFRGILSCGFLLIFSVVGIASEQKIYQFNIPQQPLAKSLNELSNQTKTLVLFPYDLVEKRQGNAVKGQYTLKKAIDTLLLNTGLIGGLSKKEVMMVSEQQTSALNQNVTIQLLENKFSWI